MLLEFLAGGALSRRLHTYPDLEPPHDELDRPAKFRAARDVASGLAYLHTKNVAHLDLKPDNILVTSDGVAKASFDLSLQSRVSFVV